MKKRKERRKPFICPYCKHEMTSMNRFESMYDRIEGFYVWYVCPSRRGEGGCSHSMLVEISPKTKCPRRIVDSVKFRKIESKKRAGK